MQQIFNQLLQFLQQGISAIFRFVQLIWQWTVGQITSLTRVPWQDWPLLKQILLVLVIAGVIWALFKAGQVEEARETIRRALSFGTKDPHILYHAGIILMSTGDIAGGTALLQETLAVNPRYNSFHVHRG